MSQSAFQQSIAAVAQAPGQLIQSAKANGLIKRNSIFSRPESRNSSIDIDASNTEAAWTSTRSPSAPSVTPRPSTSSGVMERSQTDPSLTKRHSLFRSRRKGPRKSAGDEEVSSEEVSPKQFKTADEYYTHLKKQSISQPFNFQHLSHTRRKHVPDLATVDEKGLPRVPPNDTSRPHPQSVRLDSNGIPRGFINSRPTTPNLPECGFSGAQHASSRSVDVTQSRQTMPSVVTRPRATSCQTRNVLQRSSTSISQSGRLSVAELNVSESGTPPEAQVQHRSPSEVQYRSQQPLPALPQRENSKRNSKRMTQDSQLSYTTLGGESSSTTSPRSSKSIRGTTAGPWSIRNSTTGISMASSWEDDVDFCYEQEAESTCDFNWDEMEDAEGFRLSRFLPPNDNSRTSALFAAAPQSTSPLQRRRSSIVGHRGFQHARTTSVIHEAPDNEPGAQSSQIQLETASDESKPMFGPEVMHMDASVESISDGVSTSTGSSGHHKSNSCGSCESGVRPAPPGSDNGHSSVASLNSIPELVHSTTTGSNTDATPAQEPLNAISKEEQRTLMCDIIRKPSTLSNRAILQAGRVVQRQRPTNTGRYSRMSSAQAQRPLAVDEEETTWI